MNVLLRQSWRSSSFIRAFSSQQTAVFLDGGSVARPEEDWSWVKAACTDVAKLDWKFFDHTPKSADDPVLNERLRNAQIVITNKVPLTQKHFANNPSIKLVTVPATGFNIIDMEAAKQHGVTVCNVPTYSTESTAQHTVALLLELTNRVGMHNQLVQQGEWYGSNHFFFYKKRGLQITGSSIGIIGAGRIASRVATMLAGFSPKEILGHSRSRTNGPSEQTVPMWRWAEHTDEVFQKSDIISLHCPLTPETHHIVNEKTLSMMKPGGLIVNASRGPVVDEQALRAAVDSGHIAGAALDVLEHEPMVRNNPSPCIGHENIVITPHIGWHTHESQQGLLDTTLNNIVTFLEGKPCNVVS